MAQRARVFRVAAVLAVLGMLGVPLTATAQGEAYVAYPYAVGLTNPRGLAIDEEGHLLVASLGTGNFDGAVWRLTDLDGNGMVDNPAEMKAAINGLPSTAFEFEEGAVEFAGPSGVAVAGGETYVIEGGLAFMYPNHFSGTLWSTAAENTSSNPLWTAAPYANLSSYEMANDPAGEGYDSNPFNLVISEDGTAYVNDAGANATLMVAPDGTISTYAVWPQLPNPLPFGPPDIDPVPTGIAWGPDGALYIAFLTGAPFAPEISTVYRLADDNADGDAMDDGEMEMYADGLTTVTAIAFDNDGNLLATEFRSFLTAQSPEDPLDTGRVVKWVDGEWEVIADGLFTPTGLAVGWDDTIYVTMEFAGVIMQIHEVTTEE